MSLDVKSPFIEPEKILILKTIIIQEGATFKLQFQTYPKKLFVTEQHKNEIHSVSTGKECVLTTAKNKWATLTIHGEATKFHRALGLYGQSVNGKSGFKYFKYRDDQNYLQFKTLCTGS